MFKFLSSFISFSLKLCLFTAIFLNYEWIWDKAKKNETQVLEDIEYNSSRLLEKTGIQEKISSISEDLKLSPEIKESIEIASSKIESLKKSFKEDLELALQNRSSRTSFSNAEQHRQRSLERWFHSPPNRE